MKTQKKHRLQNNRREIATKVRDIAEDVRGEQSRSLLLAVARDYERLTDTSPKRQRT